MKNKGVEIVLGLMVLVGSAALEELLPKLLATGFPVLLTASLYASLSRGRRPALAFAVAAGAMEDAISTLPALTSVTAFVLAAISVRMLALPLRTVLAAAPVVFMLYQPWLMVWNPGLHGGLYARLLAALLLATATAFVEYPLLRWLDGKAGVNERE